MAHFTPFSTYDYSLKGDNICTNLYYNNLHSFLVFNHYDMIISLAKSLQFDDSLYKVTLIDQNTLILGTWQGKLIKYSDV